MPGKFIPFIELVDQQPIVSDAPSDWVQTNFGVPVIGAFDFLKSELCIGDQPIIGSRSYIIAGIDIK